LTPLKARSGIRSSTGSPPLIARVGGGPALGPGVPGRSCVIKVREQARALRARLAALDVLSQPLLELLRRRVSEDPDLPDGLFIALRDLGQPRLLLAQRLTPLLSTGHICEGEHAERCDRQPEHRTEGDCCAARQDDRLRPPARVLLGRLERLELVGLIGLRSSRR
jgi:hypothetical protein